MAGLFVLLEILIEELVGNLQGFAVGIARAFVLREDLKSLLLFVERLGHVTPSTTPGTTPGVLPGVLYPG